MTDSRVEALTWARTNLGARVPGRDRSWRGTHTIMLLDGLDAPGAQAMRATLRQLASLAPEHRVFARPGHGYTRWLGVHPDELDERCERMVVPLDAPVDSLDGLARQLHDGQSLDLPFRIATGGGTVAVSVEHALADGRTLTGVLSELVRRASDGEPPLELARASLSLPLARALFEYFGRQPRRVLETLRSERDAVPAGPPAGIVRPWSPEFTSVSMTSERSTLGGLRRWKVANAPGVTRTAVLFAAVRAAAQAAGLSPAHPGYHVVADNRKYLPGRSSVVDGNFSVGVYVEPADPLDPSSIGEALERGTASGRPLATMALVAARSQRRRPPALPSVATVRPRPALVVNYMGRLRPFEQLPWRSGSTPRYLTASTPGAPEYLTFMVAELQGRLHVTAGFHASSFAPGAVRQAVEAVATDPAAILDATRNIHPV